MSRCLRCQRRLPTTGECAYHGRPTAVTDVVDVVAAEAPSNVVAPPGWTLGPLVASGGTALVHSISRGDAPAILKRARWRDRDMRERFELEADVLRALGAPTTPAYLEHGDVDGWPYLVMEYIPGDTLAAWMARHGERGSLGAILALLTRIAGALQVVHARGFIHRDLKPENILIHPHGVRLLDFGLAKPVGGGRGLTRVGTVVGTVHYLAPEQLATGDLDARADIYSFGVVAYEMLAGQPPFVGERRAIEYNHRVSRPAPLRERRAVPRELDELVMACLAKAPESRPRDADALRAQLASALGAIHTLRGVGTTDKVAPRETTSVVLVWIDGGDPIAVVRAVAEVDGIVVRRHGDGILAAFTSLHHGAPLPAALAIGRELAGARCRVVVHVSNALVRRSAQGKVYVYGEDVEQLARWLPAAPFAGLVLTAAAAAIAPAPVRPTGELYREVDRVRSDGDDARGEPPLVGRDHLIATLVDAASHGAAVVALCGEAGLGKSRVLAAVVAQLRAGGRDVVALSGRRRFLGEPPDDDRELAAALARAGSIAVIDDAHWLSAAAHRALLDPARPATAILATPTAAALPAADAGRRVELELAQLAYADADQLARALLRPARLVPDVLVDRLVIRAAGNPGVLVALVHDIQRRGAIRRHAAADDWYVAADELDTLLAPPGPAWFAMRALEEVPVELAPIARACSALGPRFSPDEVIAVMASPADAVPTRLAYLVTTGVLVERAGWLEFADPATQDAIYDHALAERALVHARALAFWRARPNPTHAGWLARVAYHAAGAGDATAATACWVALARASLARGDGAEAAAILDRAAAIAPRL